MEMGKTCDKKIRRMMHGLSHLVLVAGIFFLSLVERFIGGKW